MKRQVYLLASLVFFLLSALKVHAQSKVRDGSITPSTSLPHASAVMELESNNRGFLPPRMTTTQRNAIINPSAGLFIFNTTTNCTEYFNGSGWLNTCNGSIAPPSGGDASSGGSAVVSSWSSTLGCNVGAGPDNVPAGVRRGSVNETMVQGVSAPTSASITLVANVSTVGTYTIFTNTVNGVTFSASGTFGATGAQTISLRPSGIPTLAGNYMWTTNRTPNINVYGSVLTTSAPLGSYYDAHFNGCDSASGTLHSVAQPFAAASYTGGQVFSDNTDCANKPISAQGCAGVTSVTASSGRVHPTVNINGQCWLTSNLISKPSVYSSYTTASWNASSPGDQGYWGYYNTSTTSGTVGWGSTEPGTNEGLLYQWCAAMNGSTSERSRGACPVGFHVPSDCEWMYLEHGQGMSVSQQQINNNWRANGSDNQGTPGDKLRSAGSGATNASGFKGLLSGDRSWNGAFGAHMTYGAWWTSSIIASKGVYRLLFSGIRGVYRDNLDYSYGFSVRCLKD
jgi:uncharacterized protein (TIGR02145 family)